MITASSATEIASLILSSLLMLSPPLAGEEADNQLSKRSITEYFQIVKKILAVDEMTNCGYNFSVNDDF